MSNDITVVIQSIIKRFVGLPITSETLDYMEMELNEGLRRTHPKFAEMFHIEPYHSQKFKLIRFMAHKIQ